MPPIPTRRSRNSFAAEPPEGFGLTVSTSTLSRFYKEHFPEIDRLRRDTLINHTLEQSRQEMFEAGMRDMLDDGITLLLQERVYEILRQPVDSADQLKKIADICRLMKALDVEPCPHRRFIRRENERQKTALLSKIQQQDLLQQPNDDDPAKSASPPRGDDFVTGDKFSEQGAAAPVTPCSTRQERYDQTAWPLKMSEEQSATGAGF